MATDRSMPPVSIVRVWHAARIASGVAKSDGRGGPCLWSAQETRLDGEQQHHQDDEQQQQRDDRLVTEAPPPVSPPTQHRRASAATTRGTAHARFRRIASSPPIMTTMTRMTPWMTVL